MPHREEDHVGPRAQACVIHRPLAVLRPEFWNRAAGVDSLLCIPGGERECRSMRPSVCAGVPDLQQISNQALRMRMRCGRKESAINHELLHRRACTALANPCEFMFAESTLWACSVEVHAAPRPTPTRKKQKKFPHGNSQSSSTVNSVEIAEEGVAVSLYPVPGRIV